MTSRADGAVSLERYTFLASSLEHHLVNYLLTVSSTSLHKMPAQLDNKRFIEAIVGGILFGSVYFLCKFQVALEMDGNPVDPTTMVGQFFWFAKTFLGVIAAKVASQELVSLIQKTFPMVQDAVNAQTEKDRITERAKEAEVRANQAEQRANQATVEATGQGPTIEATGSGPATEPETTVRQRRLSSNLHPYPE